LAQGSSLPGLKTPLVLEMKLAGNRDGELYRLLLVAQCNALSTAMPFLFERIDDDSELLLPDNLLRSDSVIAKLVEAIAEEDWAEVEIIGWLYQFYISEKKDQVIGKVVKSEDIPAATQLFTPNWIVQYLVQNSVGRLWLMANPQSTLAQEWPYYITPAEQTPEVQAQLDALIQTRVQEDSDTPGGTLNPESITVLDPACGSGHILVVAYDVLKAIYLERGYQARAIPRLILEKNLFGLDIDDRAAQMAGFALLMKARADDRRLFTTTDDAGNPQPPKLNVLSLQSSQGLSAETIAQALTESAAKCATTGAQWGSDPNSGQVSRGHQQSITDLAKPQVQGSDPQWAGHTNTSTDKLCTAIANLINTFTHAKTFGSLIQISPQTHIDVLKLLLIVKQASQSQDLYALAAAQDLLPLLQQARLLAMKFDAVVANPPYLGSKGMDSILKEYSKNAFPDSKSDVFSMFIERCQVFGRPTTKLGFVTPYVWMFIQSYELIRKKLISDSTIESLIQLEYNAFEPACVPVCVFTFSSFHTPSFTGSYIKLSDFKGHENQAPKTLEAINNPDCDWMYRAKPDDFENIPGSPIAYWASKNLFRSFKNRKIADELVTREGMATADNFRFLRLWHEVSQSTVNLSCKVEADSSVRGRWFPYNKGGNFRKWYGNNEFLVEYENGGKNIKNHIDNETGRIRSHNYNGDFSFKEGITWSAISSGKFSIRYSPSGFLFDSTGAKGFAKDPFKFLALLNSAVASRYFEILSNTLHYKTGDVIQIPLVESLGDIGISEIGRKCTDIAKTDWDSYEISWEFESNPLVKQFDATMQVAFSSWQEKSNASFQEMQDLEERNNHILISNYDLQDELTYTVSEEQITLSRPDREKDSQRLISYAIGCMMGRYSLDELGLIYAHAGNVGFDPGRYATFPADADGIVPLTDELWFADDAPSRIREFLRAVWGPDTLEENMAWLAESLGKKSAKEASETPDETIRRYMADKFFKDHLQTYKKRPIYWLFSSGKQGAFQALVYLHRYHEGTLSRLRAEYVVPLTGKLQSRIEMLQKDADTASSTPARNKLAKEVEKLKKKHVELLAYDEQLRHHANMRITLDLDDGVKVNYGKFGDLLDSVKAVTGGASDE
jgi:type II restriction/modification system DNA methylase subunit YeeA